MYDLLDSTCGHYRPLSALIPLHETSMGGFQNGIATCAMPL
jgi:hypothetical protein